MTPVFCCGFECGLVLGTNPSPPGQGHWNAIGGNPPTISTSTVRSGARSARLTASGAACQLGTLNIAGLIGQTRWIGRWYVYFIVKPTSDTNLLTNAGEIGPAVWFRSSDSSICAAVSNSVGSPTFGITGVVVTTGQWYRIDFDFNINTSGADFCDVQVDGVACSQATNTGTSGVNPSLFVGSVLSPTDMFYDDLVVSVTAADYPIGPGYVHPFVPVSDGAHNVAGADDFERGNTGTDIVNATTTAFQLVDDVPLPTGTVDEADCIRAVAPPNATDYVEVVFGPAPGISAPTSPPRGVQVVAAVHTLGTGGSMQAQLNDNGTTDQYMSATNVLAAYAYATKHYADPPSAATAWTLESGNGNFNDLRHRFLASDADPDQCLDAVMIEAEFPEVVIGAQIRPCRTTLDAYRVT